VKTLLVLSVLIHTFPTSLDWTAAHSTADAPVYNNLMEGLVEQDQTGKIKLRIAESITRDSSGKKITFTLRKDARWSDGEAVNAQQFQDAWFRLMAPDSSSAFIALTDDIAGAKDYHLGKRDAQASVGIEVLSPRVLRVTLSKKVKDWEAVTAFFPFFPIRKDLMTRHGANWNRPGLLVTNGAFTLKSIQPDKEIVLARNPYALKNKGNADEVRMRREAPLDILWNNAGTGIVSTAKKSTTKTYPSDRTTVLALNSKRFPTNNKDFQEAIFQSIDPRRLTTLVPHSNTIKTSSLKSAALARESLKKSGVAIGPAFALDLAVRSEEPDLSVAKEVAKQMQNALNTTIRIRARPPVEHLSLVSLGEFDLLLETLMPRESLEYVKLPLFTSNISTTVTSRVSGYRQDRMGNPILRDVRLETKQSPSDAAPNDPQ
jgi:ABC-type oligopeptide transport system substrate-binding subunit